MAFVKKLWGIYDPASKDPFKVSRSKIDLFIECPRCFYLDRRLGIKRPDMPAFTLNNAVDTLLKKEFDAHRRDKTPHPIFTKYKLDAVPLDHPRMDEWRDALKRGVTMLHKETNIIVGGGVDDVWVRPNGTLIIADYKATAKEGEITELDSVWHDAYKRQLEVYQWLFRANGFTVDPIAYILYANGTVAENNFSESLKFRLTLIPYEGKTDWIEPTILKIKHVLEGPLPMPNETCKFCVYVNARGQIERTKSDTRSGAQETLFG